MDKDLFKKCTSCGENWYKSSELLSDPKASLIGYQVSFSQLTEGLFLFNHSCGTTFGISVSHFQHLYEGPVYREAKTGSEECPGFCLIEEELRPCPVKCECAFVREVMQIIRFWPKNGVGADEDAA